jgi:hypothetical protein
MSACIYTGSLQIVVTVIAACPRERRQGKGRAARQGEGGKAREGKERAARQGMGGYIEFCYIFVILQKYYKTELPDVLRELWRAHVGSHIYGKSSDLCSGDFGSPKGRASDKGRAARQGKGGKAREGRQGRQGKGWAAIV